VLTRRVAHDRGDDVRGVVGAGAGAATTTRRWCGHPMDERPCVLRGVALAHGEPQWVKVQVETGHARVHGGARLVAMGGGEHGARGWLARTQRGAQRCV
jgi:hypothetical protein